MIQGIFIATTLALSISISAGDWTTLLDDFEGAAPQTFWLPGNYGSGLHAPGAIAVSTNVARAGKQSLQVTVRKGDMASPGSQGTSTERADMDSGHFELLNKEAEYSFAVFLPKNFPIVNTRLIFATCKQSDVSRPILAQRFRDGRHTLTIESQGAKKEYRLPKLALGQWHEMKYHLRYATNNTGWIKVTMNGKEVANYSGPTAEPGFKNAFYHKIGLYRDRMEQPMTAYFDNYLLKMGSAAGR